MTKLIKNVLAITVCATTIVTVQANKTEEIDAYNCIEHMAKRHETNNKDDRTAQNTYSFYRSTSPSIIRSKNLQNITKYLADLLQPASNKTKKKYDSYSISTTLNRFLKYLNETKENTSKKTYAQLYPTLTKKTSTLQRKYKYQASTKKTPTPKQRKIVANQPPTKEELQRSRKVVVQPPTNQRTQGNFFSGLFGGGGKKS